MNQLQESQIISHSLLRWVSILTGSPLKSFQELTDGHHYLDLLKKVQNFKLMKPFQEYNKNEDDNLKLIVKQSLAYKTANIKTIGDSLIQYYKSFLLKDVSQIKINYVQLCLGSISESIKLFSLLIGIFVYDQSNCFSKFIIQSIDQLVSQDDQQIVRSLLQNIRPMGEPMIYVKKDFESPVKKKMIITLEKYQDTIQQLQDINKKLTSTVQEQKYKNLISQTQIRELKFQRTKLIQKAEVLQLLNSKLQINNHSFSVQNQSLLKKLQNYKKSLQKITNELKKKISLNQTLNNEISILRDNFQALKKINQEIKIQIYEKQDYWKGEQTKYNLIQENYNEVKSRLKSFQQKYVKIQRQYDQLRLNIRSGNKFLYQQSPYSNKVDYGINQNQSLVQSSLRYRTNNQLSSMIRNQWCQLNSKQFQLENSKYFQCQKNYPSEFIIYNQNQSINHQIHSISQYKEQSNQKYTNSKKGLCQNSIQLQINKNEDNLDHSVIIQQNQDLQRTILQKQKNVKTIQTMLLNFRDQKFLNYCQNLQQQRIQQHQILITTIQYLLTENQKLFLELSKYYEHTNDKQNRIKIFKKKLNQLKQINAPSQIENQIIAMKQNLINQNNKHIPLSMIQKQKDKSKSQPLNKQYKLIKQNQQSKIQQKTNKTKESIPFYHLTHI